MHLTDVSKISKNVLIASLRNWVPKILLLLGVGLACFLFSEVVVRVLWSDTIVVFPRFHVQADYEGYTLRRLEPNMTFRHMSVDGEWEFRTNAQGFRDDEDYAFERTEGIIRILSLGDSNTQGFEVHQEYTFSEVIERSLAAKGFPSQVLNTGISGFSTAEQLAFLESTGIKYKPDIVVLGFYANDFEDNIKAGLFAMEHNQLISAKTSHLPGVRALQIVHMVPFTKWLSYNSYFYSLGLNTMWEMAKRQLLQDAMAEYAVATETITEVKKALMGALLARMYEVCSSRGIALVLVDIPMRTGPRTCASSIPIDMMSQFEQSSDVILHSDKIFGKYQGVAEIHVAHGHHHLSEFGHLMVGVAAADWIARFVENKQGE